MAQMDQVIAALELQLDNYDRQLSEAQTERERTTIAAALETLAKLYESALANRDTARAQVATLEAAVARICERSSDLTGCPDE